MEIRPNKDVIGISLFLCSIAVGYGVLFYLTFKSVLLTYGIILFCLLVAIRFFVAFGRTFMLDETGITVSILGLHKKIAWEQFAHIAAYDSKNSLGYKDVACAGIEFSVRKMTRRLRCSPATYCFLFRPCSYIFCTYENIVVQPNGIKYPIIYAVDEKEILAKLTAMGILSF